MNATITNILMVGAGSCAGGIARYLVGRAAQTVFHTAFPWGTLLVNIIGCFIIGLAYGFLDRGVQLSVPVKLFITVGFCGGFTTFSTFMHENYLLFTGVQHLTAALYVLASAIGGLLMVWLGYWFTRL